MELRGLLQWELTPKLRSVPGVIEVNAMGGAAKEYQVVLDPGKLAAHRLTLGQVLEALERNNANVGGGWIERGSRAAGDPRRRSAPHARRHRRRRGGRRRGRHARSRCARLGEAQIGAALPQGVVTRDGKGEAVTGTVLMLVGQNSRDVVHAVKAKIEQLAQKLPEGRAHRDRLRPRELHRPHAQDGGHQPGRRRAAGRPGHPGVPAARGARACWSRWAFRCRC